MNECVNMFFHSQEKPSENKIMDDTDSDSSSLPSLDDEDGGQGKKKEVKEKRKTEGKKKSDNRGAKVSQSHFTGNHYSVSRYCLCLGIYLH